jgi:ferrous iron transport protein B
VKSEKLSPASVPGVAGSPGHLVTLSPCQKRTAALIGNPNTGKTTLFNALSGLRQRVGNYPGVTVETKKGAATCAGRPFDLVDLPGTYSLAPRSPDEMVAVDVILGQQAGEARPDVVVAIVDASNLERNLYLTTQALELGVPVVVALNMIDVARSQGVTVDAGRLSHQLGVPVVPVQANKGLGLDRLREAIAAAAGAGPPPRTAPFPEAFEREAQALHRAAGEDVPAFLVRRLLLDVGGYTEERLAARRGASLREEVRQARARLAAAGCPVPAVEARSRYAWVRQVTAGCVERPRERPVTATDRLDRVLTHRVWGTLIFLAVMALVFQAIFTGARPLMKLLGDGKDFLADFLRGSLPPGPFTSLLTDGVLEGVGSVVVFLPQILILFAFIALLEDCGYMARAAFLMDRVMARCGLSGKSFIPLLSSVACAVPGIMATRVIEDRRDRLTTILVAPLMSCSARLPVYILLIAAFLTAGYPSWLPGVAMFGLYAVGLVAAPLMALALKRTLLRGQTPVFVMEMPAYKRPSLRLVLRRMFDSGWAFVRRAGTLILASMVVVWALLYFPNAEGPEMTQSFIARLQSEPAPDEQFLAQVRRDGLTFDLHRDWLRRQVEDLQEEAKKYEEGAVPEDVRKALDARTAELNELTGRWQRQSWLGRAGRAIEPAVRPLGWDWKVGTAALASFPAREVVVGTLGIIYNEGKVDTEEIRTAEDPTRLRLAQALQAATWDDDPGRKVFTVPAALSLLVFFALCCQCASTLAVIRRETRSWRWPLFTFTYMTVLAYLAALVVYQVGTALG